MADLSEHIRENALLRALTELAATKDLARADDTEANFEKLMPWDKTFWDERLKENKFDTKAEELRSYCAIGPVLDRMSGLGEEVVRCGRPIRRW